MTHTYADAGVDIHAADAVKLRLKKLARSTFRPEVLSDIGHFGGMFKIPESRQGVLVSSTDGVGTKLKIAAAAGKYDTVGQDLVNHCVNDILCCGASPLFFLDYIAMGKLFPERVVSLVGGLAKACKQADCALIGGETAEMPGIYTGDDFDLAGFVVGLVERDQIKDGKSIRPGDFVFGLPSTGLHTNGYSLARNIFDGVPLDKEYPGLEGPLGEALLAVHRCYLQPLKPALPIIKGLAHITGGGLEGNVPRVLPEGIAVNIHRGSWQLPPLFRLIQEQGKVQRDEMYRVFNMGIGMVIVCAPESGAELARLVPDALRIGETVAIKGNPAVVFE
ncbi:MAG: phosphoribosylformylglycinamidine cyclo-ligase [Dehalococcoidia bacterium]|nr:phosphoribosylformylglycinamidine cyclo-ligase [Dehalococcoidia bacterium]